MKFDLKVIVYMLVIKWAKVWITDELFDKLIDRITNWWIMVWLYIRE